MRFHVLAVPHTVTIKAYSACAFTQKVLKFCAMMHVRGHEIIHYGHERSEVDCTEHVTVTDDAILEKAYGKYDWRSNQFKHTCTDFAHTHFNIKAAQEVAKRKKPGDFLLLFWGIGHEYVAKENKDMIVVEPGIGSYNKLVAPYAVFESYAVLHHIYAKYDMSPRFFDCVVPNYFDSRDFINPADLESAMVSIRQQTGHSETLKKILQLKPKAYAVLIARIVPAKGIQLAIEACMVTKTKLIIAGQGSLKDAILPSFNVPITSIDDPEGITHIGYIEPEERKYLLANAKCLLAPTLYAEPFCGVNVEAQLSGVPVVCTDWGVFPETVVHGTTGWRCRTLDHFAWAMKNLDAFKPQVIRDYALANWGFNKVATMYEEYFYMLSTTTKKGFYQENIGRLGLKWLEKTMPCDK
jgi:glycosyltransferase involved in cell wall biosynthesis